MFNWFRRALGKTENNTPPENSPEQKSEPTPARAPLEIEVEIKSETATPSPDPAIAPPAPPESSPEETQPDSKVDYLAWAKAAFDNIRLRQAPTLSLDTESRPEPDQPISPAISTSPVEIVDAAEGVETVAPEPTRPEEESAATGISEEISTLALESFPIEPNESPEAELSPPETNPQPAVSPESLLVPSESSPMPLVLDEGFLWSAEVLAAQGRRPEDVDIEEITWLQKLRQGLGKTRRGLVNQLKAVVGRGPLGADAVDEIESLLLQADVGVAATDKIIQALQAKIRQDALPADQALSYLKEILRGILEQPYTQGYDPNFAPKKQCLNIWLITGVNGVGKTTTIGKIAHVASTSGYPCLVAAADTFRAAAVEQVKIWAARSGVEVISNPGKNTDPAAVVFDGISAAQARNCELLLIDTAGRLQNKQNLMEELKKIRRIVDKKAPDAHIESLLVLDATLGQNGLRQAQVFAEAAQLTGVVITKLDGTAKGGVALAVVQELGLPIRFIGAGEGIKDLRPFSSYEFVEALLSG